MTDRPESVEDVLREMREPVYFCNKCGAVFRESESVGTIGMHGGGCPYYASPIKSQNTYIDRIEAALKRERGQRGEAQRLERDDRAAAYRALEGGDSPALLDQSGLPVAAGPDKPRPAGSSGARK